MQPAMALVGIAVFLLVAGKTRVPALGSLTGMASATVYAFLTDQPTSVWFIALLTSVLLVFTHRGNLARLVTRS
jgi:glycerol-3-phosphate acyltransferase PlsY